MQQQLSIDISSFKNFNISYAVVLKTVTVKEKGRKRKNLRENERNQLSFGDILC